MAARYEIIALVDMFDTGQCLLAEVMNLYTT